ncbi:MAG: phosphatidylglycerophosphatase A [Gammaproteobacteria bacterium]|nr:phosphatidylglycerophosphatase A [Gammaproteobacteria bacterium]MDD9863512.1 phosphatidylglycerophosphatase A [Gammaproteobacteria bacterium]
MNRGGPSPAALLSDPGHFLALGAGLGLSPVLPGTLGSLWALPLHLWLRTWTWWGQALALAALFLAGIWLCGRTAAALGRSDPGAVVWDETVGCLLALAAAGPGWWELGAAFLLFRLFDIVKPWPIRWLERRLAGGLGIMLDDVAAAAAAAACLALWRYFPV